jgi:hypothetical protein
MFPALLAGYTFSKRLDSDSIEMKYLRGSMDRLVL